MKSSSRVLSLSTLLLSAVMATPVLAAEMSPEAVKALYEKVTPSMVVVKYAFNNEMRLTEIEAVGVVVGDGGLVMTSGMAIPPFPDEQLKDFKIVVPKYDTDHEELDAVFLGRDERSNTAFFKLKEPKDLPKVTFVDKKPNVGDEVWSIGLHPKETGYRTTINKGSVAGKFRGSTPSYMFDGKLADAGGLVFNASGEAIGYVFPPERTPAFLTRFGNAPVPESEYFVAADEFLPGIAHPPIEGKPTAYPFSGIFGMTGLTKDLSEVYGLTGKPAVEIGDVVPGSAAEKAGLVKGMIVTEVDGKPIERADQPEELDSYIAKALMKKSPGDTVKFTVITKKGEAPKPVEVKLEERPSQPNTAKRFFAEDLGFTVRDTTFIDLYGRKLPLDTKGLVIDFIKQGSQAESARVGRGDIVTQINGEPVTDLASYKKAYETLRKDKPREAIVLQVKRAGKDEIIRIEPPQ